MQSGSRTDLARLALHDSLAAHTEHSDRAAPTTSSGTSASPLGAPDPTTAAVKLLTREEWQGLRQLPPPPRSPSNAGGDTPPAPRPPTSDASDDSRHGDDDTRPPAAAAAPPSQAYGAVAVDRGGVYGAAGPFHSPLVQECLNSGGQKGPLSDGGGTGPNEDRTAELKGTASGASGRRLRGQEASYASTLHMSNPTQSSLSTVQTLSAIPHVHPDDGGALSSIHMIGSEPYRMHHIGFPIMEPSPVANHSPTIISQRAADIFRWNSKETLSVSTPVATTSSAPASINAAVGLVENEWPAPGRRTYRPEAVAEGMEDVSSSSDDEEPAVAADPSRADTATEAPAGPSQSAAAPSTQDGSSTQLHRVVSSIAAVETVASRPRTEPSKLSTETSSITAPRAPAPRPASGSRSSHSGSWRPPSQHESDRTAMLIAAPGPDSLPPPSASLSPNTTSKMRHGPPPAVSAAGRTPAAPSALQVDVVDDDQPLPRWVQYLPRRRNRSLSTSSSRNIRRTCSVVFTKRGRDVHGSTALAADALRTTLFAFLLPVFAWPVEVLLAIALVATVAQAALATFMWALPSPTHFVTLACEIAVLGFALVWSALVSPSGDEAWCATLACTLPLALLWSLAAASNITRLGICLSKEVRVWRLWRAGSTASTSSAASDTVSKPPTVKDGSARVASADCAAVTVAAVEPAPVPVRTRSAAAPEHDMPQMHANAAAGPNDMHHGHASGAISAGYASEVTLAVPSATLPPHPVPRLSATATNSSSNDTAEPPEATGTEGLSPTTAYSGSRGPPTPLTDRPVSNQLPQVGGYASKPPVPTDATALNLSARRTNTVSSAVRSLG